jgi:hypothetical protein
MIGRLATLLFLFVTFKHECFGQGQMLIKGIVADSATFNPLPYVNIQIRGSTRGVRSDIEGNFSIQATAEDTLLFSFVGYRTVELPLWNWEPGVVLMNQIAFELKSITIQDTRLNDLYENLFDDQNARLKKENRKLPFYYSRLKKEKIKIHRLGSENIRVATYLDVINNPDVKGTLMKKYALTETEYYAVLRKFNERNYQSMYYLTHAELLSHLYRFFDAHARSE